MAPKTRNLLCPRDLRTTRSSIIATNSFFKTINSYLKDTSEPFSPYTPDVTINGEQFNTLTSPVLYIWWREGKALYVGTSLKGFGRFADHHVIGRKEEVLSTDTLDFTWMEIEKARKLESELIQELRPKYNIQRREAKPIKEDGHKEALEELMKGFSKT